MFNSIKYLKLKKLNCAVLVAALVMALPVLAADKPSITANTDVKPVTTLSADESLAVPLAAGHILLHTDKARLAIAKKDKKTALDEVNQGLTLVQVIQNAIPKYKVTTTIGAGGTTNTTENEEVSQRYVTVFSEQYIEDIVEPLIQAKKQNQKTAKPGQSKQTTDKSATAPLEDFSNWRRSMIKLNVYLASDALELAKNRLDKDRTDLADTALAILQTEGVIFVFDEVEFSLNEAANNLKLAELQIGESKSEEASATLKLASDDLKKYEQLAGESRTKDVRELHQKVDKLAESLDKGNNSQSMLDSAKKEIGSYWKHVVTWFK